MSGILLGSAIAYGQGAFRWDIFSLALLTTVLFQVLSDYANDYGDAQKGTDNEHRIGPKRAIQTGAMSLGEMKRVVVVTAVLSAISALSLIVLSFREQWGLALIFVLLGGAAIFAAIRYTVGKSAYGYKGLGDVFVFIFGDHNPTTVLYHIISGGLIFGAFFMATDYVSSPVTKKGQIYFAIFIGVLTGLFRLFGGNAEGVSYAIIIGNIVAPLIEKSTLPKAFGREAKKA